MPVHTVCPSCQQSYNLDDATRGRMVRCRHCQRPFRVRDADDLGPPPDRGGPSPRRPARWWLLAGLLAALLITAGVGIFLATRPGEANPSPGGGGARAPARGLLRAASIRFPVEPKDIPVRNLLFAPQAKQVGCYMWIMQDPTDYHFALFDAQNGQRLCLFELKREVMTRYLDLSPDGTRLATLRGGNLEAEITLFSLPDGKILRTKWDPFPVDPKRPQERDPEFPDFNINRGLAWFAFVDRDRLLLVAGDGRYDLFDTAKNKTLYSCPVERGRERRIGIGLSHQPSMLALSPDRKRLALTNRDGYDLIETATGRVLCRTAGLVADGRVIREAGVAFSPDGRRLAANLRLGGPGRGIAGAPYVAIWDVATGKRERFIALPEIRDAGGLLTWWGHAYLAVQQGLWQNEFAVLSVREGRWVALGAAGRPVPRRMPIDSRSGRLAETSPDGRLWYATYADGPQAAEVVAVDCPEDVLADPPRPIPRWSLRPDGLHASDD